MSARWSGYQTKVLIALAGGFAGACLVLADASTLTLFAAATVSFVLLLGFMRVGFKQVGNDIFRAHTERFGDRHSVHVFAKRDDIVAYLGSAYFARGLILTVIFGAAAGFMGGAE